MHMPVSGPLDFARQAGTELTVTASTSPGQAALALTSHPGSRTTSYLVHGDRTREEEPSGRDRP
ncbi:hypothetical protein [Streptomyces sp. NPDC006309]|uniref:hypothetical protein n=1 Tax=Streptomyces sp. NPDC006309 TaxID=3156749 RepID=UPI0033A9F186